MPTTSPPPKPRIERLPWPLITMDFEAGALGPASWPIEVGICRWVSPEAPIEGWSSLIRPTADWLENAEWSPDSAEIHHIPREALGQGMEPEAVMSILNPLLAGQIVWCDGGPFDQRWLDRLADAAGIAPTFRLGDLDKLTSRRTFEQQLRMIRCSVRRPIRHRARADAEMHLIALAHGFGFDDKPMVDLAMLAADGDRATGHNGDDSEAPSWPGDTQ